MDVNSGYFFNKKTVDSAPCGVASQNDLQHSVLKDGCFANIFIVNFLTPLHCKLSNSHGRHIHPVSNAQLKEYKKIVCGNEDDMHFLFCNGACNKENETHKETFKYCKSGSESAAHKFVRTACDVLGSREDTKNRCKDNRNAFYEETLGKGQEYHRSTLFYLEEPYST